MWDLFLGYFSILIYEWSYLHLFGIIDEEWRIFIVYLCGFYAKLLIENTLTSMVSWGFIVSVVTTTAKDYIGVLFAPSIIKG